MPVEIDAGEVQRLLRDEHALLVEVLPERELSDQLLERLEKKGGA